LFKNLKQKYLATVAASIPDLRYFYSYCITNLVLHLLLNTDVMKQILMAISMVIIGSNCTAQSIGENYLRTAQPKNVAGEKYLNIQTIIPISLSSVIGGGTVNFLPTYVSYDYGVYKNITIGGLLGYSSTTSKDLASASGYSLLNIAQQLLCDNDPATASTLGINCSKTSNSVKYVTNYVLIGANAKYFVEAGAKTDVYGSASLGYKIGSNKELNNTTSIPLLNDIATAYNESSKVFVTTSIGANLYVDAAKKYAIKAEGGYGYGLGDNIVFGTRSIVLGVGFIVKL
jgi:hypothetical protein